MMLENNLEQLNDGLMLVYENFTWNTLTHTLTKTLKEGRIVYLKDFVYSYKKVDRIFEIDHGLHKLGNQYFFNWFGVSLK